MNKELIVLKNINKWYIIDKSQKVHALDDFSLIIDKGEFVAIQGKSGAGKSTLLHILELIDKYDDGEFLFEGQNVKEFSDKQLSEIRNKKIGIVLQSYGIVNDYTALENVMFPLYFGKFIKNSTKKQMALDALNKVGVQHLANNRASKISGGEQQRVAIARAIVNNPEVLYLDEPTGALDSETAMALMNLLKELNKSGVTIIMVTHDSAVASNADRIIKIEDGKKMSDSKENQ